MNFTNGLSWQQSQTTLHVSDRQWAEHLRAEAESMLGRQPTRPQTPVQR
jgi:hypothetical protein